MFILNSKITIGNFKFSGVNDVRIKRSMHSYVDIATIKIPSICNVLKKDGSRRSSRVNTADQFEEGDKVVIELGYNERYKQEFEGFVKRKGMSTPLEVECEGYVRQLRLNNCGSKYFASTTAKDLLEMAVKGTDIKVECSDNIPLIKIQLIGANGCDICDYIKKATEEAVTIFFKEPKVLWCGLAYTAVSNNKLRVSGLPDTEVKYRLGYNVVKNNQLKERQPNKEQLVQVILNGLQPGRKKILTKSQVEKGVASIRRLLIHLPDKNYLQRCANELENQKNYSGYEGSINAFLEPFCQPANIAYIIDKRYPKKAGTYIIESVEVSYGISGARRKVELGPKTGFEL